MTDFQKLITDKKSYVFRVKIQHDTGKWRACYAVNFYFLGRCQAWCEEKQWRQSSVAAWMDALAFVYEVNGSHDILQNIDNTWYEQINPMG